MSDVTDAFRGTGFTVEGPLDLRYFGSMTNESVALDALALVANPAFIAQIGKFHTEQEIADLRRSVFRSCISLGIPLPSKCQVQARMLGVIAP